MTSNNMAVDFGDNEFIDIIKKFKAIEDSLDANFNHGLKRIKGIKQLKEELGKYLHDLRRTKPDVDILQKIITLVPSCLSYKDDNGRLPIHTAARYTSTARYVPLLADEGIKYKVGGYGKRGGLLVKAGAIDCGANAMQLVSNLSSRTQAESTDTVYFDVLKELKHLGLLVREDIKEQNLLFHSCCPNSRLRFNFFADWDPHLLIGPMNEGLLMIHALIEKHGTFDRLSTFLQTSLRIHESKDMGCFFLKDKNGKTFCEKIFTRYGKKETFKLLGGLIPFEEPQLPILHYVVKHAPRYLNEFVMRYPSAVYLQSAEGRTLHQEILASGCKKFQTDPMFFVGMSYDQVREADPRTGLFPFMTTASQEAKGDIDSIYFLLRRDPAVMIGKQICRTSR